MRPERRALRSRMPIPIGTQSCACSRPASRALNLVRVHTPPLAFLQRLPSSRPCLLLFRWARSGNRDLKSRGPRPKQDQRFTT